MAFQFFESSSPVKKYIDETVTSWVRNVFNTRPAQEIYVSRITEVEVTAAITQRRKGGSLSASDTVLALQQLRSDFLVRFRILDFAVIVTAHDRYFIFTWVETLKSDSTRGGKVLKIWH